MKKIGTLFSKVNVPMAAFIIYTLYSVITGFSIASSVASFAFCSLYGFQIYLSQKQNNQSNALLDRVKNVEDGISTIKMANGFKAQNEPRKLY